MKTNGQEFNLKAEGDVLIEHQRNSSYVVATFDVRDILDDISNKDIYDWKGEELLKEFTKDELLKFVKDYHGLDD